MDKQFIINEIMRVYGFTKKGEFADFLGINQQVLSNWIKRNSFDVELIFTKCEKISAEFILTGKGNIFRTVPENNKVNLVEEEPETYYKEDSLLNAHKKTIHVLEKQVDDLIDTQKILKDIIKNKL